MTGGIAASTDIEALETQLNSFDPHVRADSLAELANMSKAGKIHIPALKNEVNLHFHTFFSFNGNGWSPTRIAWESRKYGLAVAGIVDFDVLDGLDEFLRAGEVLDLRTTSAIETRTFIKEYSDHVMNSPNEPGITYFMICGCFQTPQPGTKGAEMFQVMRDMARRRNVQVMEHVNDYLDTVRLDYDADVLPLTPSGNATERHLLVAYDAKSRKVFGGNVSALTSFWADALEIPLSESEALLADTVKFHEKMRSKLMKFGGVGYVPPAADTFPTVEFVIDLANEIHALPTATWLDGTNSGEADMPAMLELMASKGACAMNAVPDRSWNLKDPEDKRIKMENMAKAIKAAREVDFPLNIGTEMNKAGLPFVDNFSAPELQPYVEDFVEGAYFIWGHTMLSRVAGIGYASEWSKAYFGNDRRRKNEFYTKAGRLAGPADAERTIAGKDLNSASPADVLRMLGA